NIITLTSGMAGVTDDSTTGTGSVVVTAPAGNTLAAGLNLLGKLVGGAAMTTLPYTPGAGDQSFKIDLNDGNGVQAITLAGGPYAAPGTTLAAAIQAAVRAQAVSSTASAGFTATAAASVLTFTSGAGGAIAVTANGVDTLASELKMLAASTPTSSVATSTTGTDFTLTNPTGTSNFSTSMTVYDSLGNGHLLTTYFTNVGSNTWNYNVTANSSDVVTANYNSANIDATLGITRVGAGSLTFGTNGTLDRESNVIRFNNNTAAGTIGAAAGQLNVDWNGATANQLITYNFGTSVTTEGGNGLDGTTQFGSQSAVVQLTQDGYAAGSLQAFSVDGNGIINGRFSNGQLRALAQVVLARFPDPLGLTRTGNNTFAQSGNSGQPVTGVPENAGLGKLKSNTLELSNVDLGESFIDMIAAQRGFQANSRVITTSDEILQELVNLKR
ncbi:MAG: flagellar hook-basal body complex protein, partial [Nitrospirae bacterium]|nr:flagellar hook-basal body complex protein [Nitrospirota bacterium]